MTETKDLVWLTAEYIEPILQRYFKDNTLRVKSLHSQPATAKGDNYVSILTRFHVKYVCNDAGCVEEKCTNFLVKTMQVNDPFVQELLVPYYVFDVEMEMYERVLPQLSELLQQTGDTDKLFANTMHVDRTNEAILFEDLSVMKFVNGDRVAGVDLVLARLALRKLAKMHATAAVLNERTGGSLQKFDRGIINKYTSGFNPFFEHVTGECAEFAGNCPELGPYYKEKLLKLKPHLMDYTYRAQRVREHEFNTLNHGDYWTNNVMLRYDTETGSNGSNEDRCIRDLLIIDFQFSKWGSPALDLHYFFKTSLPLELNDQHEQALVQHYHLVLAETLRQLHFGGHIPTLHELTVQLEVGRFQALTMALGPRALLTNDNPADASYQTMLLDDEPGRRFRRSLYARKPQQELLKHILPYFDHRGLLDVDN